jgi:aminopeptidase
MDDLIKKYARLLVKIGVNLQEGQLLVVNTPIECAEFARAIAEAAYQAGGRDVVLCWQDELFDKLRFTEGKEEIFDTYPAWKAEMYISYAKAGAAFISIKASDPDLLKDVNQEWVMRAQKAGSIALEEYRERTMSNRNAWCVASVPTAAWAKRVFPELSETAALEKLWQVIYQTVRVDQPDPVAAWEEHKRALKNRVEELNNYKFKILHYQNSLGTDLTIELPKGHIWLAASGRTADGVEFIANMPTEEVYTLPNKKGVSGRVVSSKPLNYQGTLIDNFSFTFQDGKVIEYHAETGSEALKGLLAVDEGAIQLGEVALVPFDSPISNSNILFYNTLFDENASCHLAFGKAYPVCIEGGTEQDKETLVRRGVNDSLIHVDFMIGTKDLRIVGITEQGEQINVFKDGNFMLSK